MANHAARLLLAFAVSFLLVRADDALPIETGTIERTTADGPLRGRWAKVRLDHPAVEIVVTGRLAPEPGLPPKAEARLTTVPDWAEREQLVLAVNANFFAAAEPPPPGTPDPGWVAGRPVDLVGLSVSDGVVVSPPRLGAGRGDPAVLFRGDGQARIVAAGAEEVSGVADAVAGIGATDDGRQPGDLLVADGCNLGATARVAPAVRHPRTAAGVTAHGRTLILVVVDGRQPDHSVGATLPELADILIALGADDAVNLDGGGSSSFWYRPDADAPAVTNRPSGGRWRSVGNHLGVRLRRS